jgi:hypothetical protein
MDQGMRYNRITLAVALLSMLSWTSTSAFAGHKPPGYGHGHKAGITEASTGGIGRHGGGHGKHVGAFRSNKGGALRGVDRANQVAGSHGEEGRENASAHHSNAGSSHDADE